ncbi:hypothetical protein KIH23_08560 [Flavobacterium sp. CYK-55]|uniref:hypothetical protein n=1 Tax=Flavobacterium sp. CYK-55 TaxID=2835529 RepID=UPI001BCC79B4|nr:hypothetical protein [Flavobacterium sp. CYK-55]MBS7787348.1 hypothetical protein [Flavobacterium sp. CYK-55]
MGKSLSILKITGHFEGLSFYELNGQIVVRRTGGFDSKKLKTDPKYARVREHNQAFTESSICGKYFRQALKSYLPKLRVSYVHSRVLGLFQQITQLDTQNPKGALRFFEGLKTPQAHALVQNFEFDSAMAFSALWGGTGQWNASQTTYTLNAIKPKQIQAPEGATHVGLRLIDLGLDFEQLGPALIQEGNVQLFSLNPKSSEHKAVVLTTKELNAPSQMSLLFLEFYQAQDQDMIPCAKAYLKVIKLKIKNSDA